MGKKVEGGGGVEIGKVSHETKRVYSRRTGAFWNVAFQRSLVFKYPPPGKLNVSPMRVYLMPDLWSFTTCNFKMTKLVGNPTEGSGEGLEVQLNPRQPYYFASADGNG
ncbi:hypothetical protein K1719_016383 [Acacia pycnantha]|nr:hypothetical protein K1719_016383 [Acacia pycnantha]